MVEGYNFKPSIENILRCPVTYRCIRVSSRRVENPPESDIKNASGAFGNKTHTSPKERYLELSK